MNFIFELAVDRHPRFGGTYVMKGMKSISDKDIIYHRALVDAKEHTFDNGKKWKRKPKNRKPIDGKVLIWLCLV